MNKNSLMITIAILGVLLSGCKVIVNKMAFFPDTTHVIPADQLPEGIEELAIASEDKLTLTGLFLPAKYSDKLVIYFHGNGGNIYGRLPSLIQLRHTGVNVIGAGYRGYANNEGEPSEEGLYLDGKAVFNYAVYQLGFLPENIIVLGRSIGTTVAINTAQHQEIGGLILVTPLTSGRAHANEGALSFVSWLAGDAFNNIDKMKNISSPVLVIHGTRDRVIPYSMGQEIFEAVVSSKKLVTIAGGGHNDLHDIYADTYWSSIYDFLNSAWGSQKLTHR